MVVLFILDDLSIDWNRSGIWVFLGRIEEVDMGTRMVF